MIVLLGSSAGVTMISAPTPIRVAVTLFVNKQPPPGVKKEPEEVDVSVLPSEERELFTVNVPKAVPSARDDIPDPDEVPTPVMVAEPLNVNITPVKKLTLVPSKSKLSPLRFEPVTDQSRPVNVPLSEGLTQKVVMDCVPEKVPIAS